MTKPSTGTIAVTPHEVNRLSIEAAESFERFRERYEQAVPPFDAPRFELLASDNADWDDVLRATAELAPHDFLIYWYRDFSPLMRLAGNELRGVEYLMGNHTITQRMYRHNPEILLYSPLRTAIYEDSAGTTWFTIDQPSTRFASFDNPDITEVGLELDRKLAALCQQLEIPVPATLGSDHHVDPRRPSA